MERRRIPGERPPLRAEPEELEMLGRLSPYVRQAGDGLRQPWHMTGRKLLDFLIVGVGSGAGVFTVGDWTFPVAKNDVIWVPPDTFHEMRGTEPMLCSYAHFDLIHSPATGRWDACIPVGTLDLSEFKSLLHPKTGTAVDSWSGKLPLSNGPEAIALIKRIAAERERRAYGCNILLSGLLLELLALILRGLSGPGAGGGEAQTRIRKAASRIAESGGAEKVGSMARESSVSGSHFRRLFKRAYGQSPREAALKERMRKACELLVYSGLNVSEVAAKLGYSNVHNFSRAFAKELGVAPGGYREGL